MKTFNHMLFAVGFAGLVLLASCQKKDVSSSKQTQASPNLTALPGGASSSAAGIHWAAPSRWSALPPRAMRVASYSIPAAPGDPEDGECAVFYFGSAEGGAVEDNVNRWISQFEQGATHSSSTSEVNSVVITRVQIDGTYLAPSGPMMESQGKKAHYRLLGAIVSAPGGLVFFKCTGPTKTLSQAEPEFSSLINSMNKSPV